MGRWVDDGNVDDSGRGGWVIIIFQGVLTKLNLLTKFRHLKKIIFFAFFCCGGGSNLILGTGMENSSCYHVFSSNSQKLSLWCKKKSFLTHMDLYDPYMVPYTIF